MQNDRNSQPTIFMSKIVFGDTHHLPTSNAIWINCVPLKVATRLVYVILGPVAKTFLSQQLDRTDQTDNAHISFRNLPQIIPKFHAHIYPEFRTKKKLRKKIAITLTRDDLSHQRAPSR